MPTEKGDTPERALPEETAGPSTESSSTSEQPSEDNPSMAIQSYKPGKRRSTEDEDKTSQNSKKRYMRRIAPLDPENDDVFGFDDTSSSSNFTVDTEYEEVNNGYEGSPGTDNENGSVEVGAAEEEDDDSASSSDDDDDIGFDDPFEEGDDIFNRFDTSSYSGNDDLDDDDDDDDGNILENDFDEYNDLENDFDDDSAGFDMSTDVLSDVPEDSSDEDSELPDDPFEREVLGSLLEPETSVHMAVVKGDTKTLQRWQTWGTGVWSRKVKGDTHLHYAARSGDVATVESLLKTGSDRWSINKKRHTPLEVAALCGHAEVVKCLLKHGGNTEPEQMEHALLATKSSAVIKVLAEEDENLLLGVTGVDVLSRAVLDGRVRMVQALLKGGANANWPGIFSRTALHTAASRGHVRCLSALLERNGDVTSVDDRNWTPLHYAAYHSHRECVRVLLAAGANPVARSGEGQTPYDVAFDEVIHRLLENA